MKCWSFFNLVDSHWILQGRYYAIFQVDNSRRVPFSVALQYLYSFQILLHSNHCNPHWSQLMNRPGKAGPLSETDLLVFVICMDPSFISATFSSGIDFKISNSLSMLSPLLQHPTVVPWPLFNCLLYVHLKGTTLPPLRSDGTYSGFGILLVLYELA